MRRGRVSNSMKIELSCGHPVFPMEDPPPLARMAGEGANTIARYLLKSPLWRERSSSPMHAVTHSLSIGDLLDIARRLRDAGIGEVAAQIGGLPACSRL